MIVYSFKMIRFPSGQSNKMTEMI